jgi:hypothetical protein
MKAGMGNGERVMGKTIAALPIPHPPSHIPKE